MWAEQNRTVVHLEDQTKRHGPVQSEDFSLPYRLVADFHDELLRIVLSNFDTHMVLLFSFCFLRF
jgi:hypothetical protein